MQRAAAFLLFVVLALVGQIAACRTRVQDHQRQSVDGQHRRRHVVPGVHDTRARSGPVLSERRPADRRHGRVRAKRRRAVRARLQQPPGRHRDRWPGCPHAVDARVAQRRHRNGHGRRSVHRDGRRRRRGDRLAPDDDGHVRQWRELLPQELRFLFRRRADVRRCSSAATSTSRTRTPACRSSAPAPSAVRTARFRRRTRSCSFR